MKKLLKAFGVVVISLALVACGSGKKDDGKETDGGDKKTKVALLIENKGDMSFNDSAARGMDKAAKDFDLEVKTIEYQSVDNVENTFKDTSESDYDVIIVNSAFTETVQKFAAEYPEKNYILFDDSVDYEAGDMKNVYSIVYSANESTFLVGYIGAKMSETGTLAFLGGVENPIINDFLIGYISGAQEANKDIKVTSAFVGDWQDSAKGKDLALEMFNQGADIGFAAAGQAGTGLIEAALDKGKMVFGVDLDQYELFKSQNNPLADVVLTSSMKNVDNSLYRAMELYKKDELKFGEKETLGIKEGGVGIADNDYYKEKVSEEIRNEVEQLQKDIIDGKVKVDSAYGKSADQIKEIKNAVKP